MGFCLKSSCRRKHRTFQIRYIKTANKLLTSENPLQYYLFSITGCCLLGSTSAFPAFSHYGLHTLYCESECSDVNCLWLYVFPQHTYLCETLIFFINIYTCTMCERGENKNQGMTFILLLKHTTYQRVVFNSIQSF